MLPMKTLDEIAGENGTDKSTKPAPNGVAHGYAPIYDVVFTMMRQNPIKLLEIGVGGGESIRTWLEYFPKATVYGVDIVHDTNPFNAPTSHPEGRYFFNIGDQSCPVFWACFVSDYGPQFDIIIDDGSHVSAHIIASFNCLWPHVRPGGLYCIEDLAVAPDASAWLRDKKVKIDDPASDIDCVSFSGELCILKKA